MAENQKYVLKDELLKLDETMVGDNSLLGMSMLTVPQYNNSMRSVMFTSHLKQFVDLDEPDFPGVFTNGENVAGKNSSGYKKVKHDTTIIKKIEKYGDIISDPFVYTLFVFDEKKKQYDVIERKDSENLTEVFGFNYNNEVIDDLSEGDFIEKGTVLYRSKSYDDDMNYGYGLNVPMMYTTDSFTYEDACIVDTWLADRMRSIEINDVAIGQNHNDFLLNMYGDSENYKCIPDLGEYSDGEVAVKRTLTKEQLLTDFKDSSLSTIFDSDICYYKTGQVVDIQIYCNNPDLEETPFNEQIMRYLRSQTKYYESIKETCKDIIKSGAKYTRALDSLYKRACEFTDEDKKWKDNNSVFSNLYIVLTIKNSIPLQIGQKLTGRYGNKSVISQIRDVKDMPYYYDDEGNKVVVHLLKNILEIINRTTGFPIYEVTTNFIANKIRLKMRSLKTYKQREKLLFDFVNDFNPKQYASMKSVYDSLDKKQKQEYIDSAMNERIYLNQEPMRESEPIFFRLSKLYDKYDFLTPYDVYINKWGREIKTLNKAYVGEMYVIKLKQTSRKGFSVRGTGSINSKGLPERNYKNKSFTEHHSSTPIRFGEFESFNFLIALLSEDVQLFHLLYRTSSRGRRDLAEKLLGPNDEFEIDDSYTSRVSEIFGVILKSLGLEIRFVDEDDELREYDDEELKEFTYDGETVIATEFQFLLMKRKKEIEKEILHKFGIIDKDELRKLVMEELMKRQYLIGTDKENYKNMPGIYIEDTIEER